MITTVAVGRWMFSLKNYSIRNCWVCLWGKSEFFTIRDYKKRKEIFSDSSMNHIERHKSRQKEVRKNFFFFLLPSLLEWFSFRKDIWMRSKSIYYKTIFFSLELLRHKKGIFIKLIQFSSPCCIKLFWWCFSFKLK